MTWSFMVGLVWGTDRGSSAVGARGFWIGALLLASTGAGADSPADPAQDVTVDTTMTAGAAHVHAHADLCTPLAVIWATLTDYEHLPDFIPGIHSSRIIERRSGSVLVEQEGSTGFLFFSHDIHVVVESVETPPYVIGAHLVRGNLRQLDGQYRIDPLEEAPGCFRLNWMGVVEPGEFVPAFLSLPIIRADLKRQFTGMVREIRRRSHGTPGEASP